jgi:hypothetical protein
MHASIARETATASSDVISRTRSQRCCNILPRWPELAAGGFGGDGSFRSRNLTLTTARPELTSAPVFAVGMHVDMAVVNCTSHDLAPLPLPPSLSSSSTSRMNRTRV